jgi:competence protein ComEC
VLGDDSQQPPELVDDFRAAGLSHLLVVSGQNVAFTFAVFEPLLRRFRRRARLVATVAILIVFTVVTRFEPSVLRAVWMAGVVAVSRCLGRPQRALRVLSLATIALIVIDPLLSYSVGFALSLGATTGLALWSAPLALRLPLPKQFRSALAPTLAAQTGASLVLLPVFGSVPVVSILANVCVVPLAAPLMGWAVLVGLPAGFLGTAVSRVVHWPTSLVLTVVSKAALIAAQMPFGSLSAVPVGVLVLLTWFACRSTHRFRSERWIAASLLILAWPTLSILAATPSNFTARTLSRGAIGWTSTISSSQLVNPVSRSIQVMEVSHGARVDRVLAGLRQNRVVAIDVLIVVNGGKPQAQLVDAIQSRISVGMVLVGNRSWGGAGSNVRVVSTPLTFRMSDLVVTVEPKRASGRRVALVTTIQRRPFRQGKSVDGLTNTLLALPVQFTSPKISTIVK